MHALPPLLEGTTPEQRAAITHVTGPMLVLAGAGSGKTLVITRRLAHLVQEGVSPDSILAVTFTNKAAREMKERILRLVPAERLWVYTFHAFCVRVLRREIERLGYPRSFTIYDEADRIALVAAVMKELGIDPDLVQPAAVVSAVSRAKNNLVSPRAFEAEARGHFEQHIARLYVRYEHSMKTSNALDFDDLLLKALELFKNHEDVHRRWCSRFRFLLVDEYQDTNAIQYELVQRLGAGHRNVCVTGDPDQAIYTWRGADIRNILRFERDFPDARVVKLEKNFRSTGNILKAADGVIVNNLQRKAKALFTDAPDGDPLLEVLVPTETMEAAAAVRIVRDHVDAGGSPGDAAVFFRTNALSRSLERAFLEAGIPYEVVGTVSFYERREIKDLLAYLKAVVNPADDLSLTRIVNTPPRGIGARTLEHVKAYADTTGLRLRQVLDQIAQVPWIRPRPRNALMALSTLLRDLEARQDMPAGEFLERLIMDLDFTGYLDRRGDPRNHERLENIQELVAAAREYEAREGPDATLLGYLEDVALVSQADFYSDQEDRVSLMTIHNAKGLEFDLVLLAGFEEGLLPHIRSLDGGENALEEERRLCYVAITRARKRLVILHAATRTVAGVLGSPRMPSRFLEEIPPEVMQQTVFPEPHDPWSHTPGRGRDAAAPRGGESRRQEDVPDLDDPVPRPDPAAPDLEVGQLVRHELFGLGRVSALEGRGPGRKVRVRFTTAGERLLVLEYAGLTAVD